MRPDKTAHFFMMYLGAFVALRIHRVDAAYELAGLTLTEAEAVRVIAILRDEACPMVAALDWLRQARAIEARV